MSKRLLRVSLAVALALGGVGGLAACGQKGPLYLPEEQEEQEEKSKAPQQQSSIPVVFITA